MQDYQQMKPDPSMRTSMLHPQSPPRPNLQDLVISFLYGYLHDTVLVNLVRAVSVHLSLETHLTG